MAGVAHRTRPPLAQGGSVVHTLHATQGIIATYFERLILLSAFGAGTACDANSSESTSFFARSVEQGAHPDTRGVASEGRAPARALGYTLCNCAGVAWKPSLRGTMGLPGDAPGPQGRARRFEPHAAADTIATTTPRKQNHRKVPETALYPANLDNTDKEKRVTRSRPFSLFVADVSC